MSQAGGKCRKGRETAVCVGRCFDWVCYLDLRYVFQSGWSWESIKLSSWLSKHGLTGGIRDTFPSCASECLKKHDL
jgi:hypothetical protein